MNMLQKFIIGLFEFLKKFFQENKTPPLEITPVPPVPTPTVPSNPHGVWIWVEWNFTESDLKRLKDTGCKRVYIKAYDDASTPRRWSQITASTVAKYKALGMSVWAWGYHGNGKMDDLQTASDIKKLISMGFEGYVFDIESELKDKSRHAAMDQVLEACRSVIPAGKMAFTSFGIKNNHPDIPWSIMDHYCDIHMPQIYFEQWTLKSGETTADIVNYAMNSFKGMKTKILPIFGAEPGLKRPAKASDLQAMVDKYEGSSVWRLTTSKEEQTAVWKIKY